jgi:hypothetical protein
MNKAKQDKQSLQQKGEESIPSSTGIDEEQEWEAIVSKPHVRNALRRLAAELLQQDAAGETEEGGFAIE